MMESESPKLKSYTCTNCGNNAWSNHGEPKLGISKCPDTKRHDYKLNDVNYEGVK